MKTITEILNEMILKNKKEIEELKKEEKLQDNYIQNMEKELMKRDRQLEITLDLFELTIKKVKKIILILSSAIILNSIAIIILNLWR